MELTPSEHKRLKRLERIARSWRGWEVSLAAVLLVVLGTAVYCILTNQRIWTAIFLLLSAAFFAVLMHMRDTRFLVHIIKKLQE